MDAGPNVEQGICMRYLWAEMHKLQLYQVHIFVEDNLGFRVKPALAFFHTFNNCKGAEHNLFFGRTWANGFSQCSVCRVSDRF